MERWLVSGMAWRVRTELSSCVSGEKSVSVDLMISIVDIDIDIDIDIMTRKSHRTLSEKSGRSAVPRASGRSGERRAPER